MSDASNTQCDHTDGWPGNLVSFDPRSVVAVAQDDWALVAVDALEFLGRNRLGSAVAHLQVTEALVAVAKLDAGFRPSRLEASPSAIARLPTNDGSL